MKYNELQVSANKDKKRVGRGISAGGGKTAGRGTKGQNSRTGKKLHSMFQGGQNGIKSAVPKARGFKSLRTPAQVVYLDRLEGLKGTVDNFALYEAGLVATPFHTVKVILRGELTSKVTLKVQAASKSVVAAIEKAGGKFEKVATPIQKSAKEAEATDKK
jgi:large subunit ribosomal protein L15